MTPGPANNTTKLRYFENLFAAVLIGVVGPILVYFVTKQAYGLSFTQEQGLKFAVGMGALQATLYMLSIMLTRPVLSNLEIELGDPVLRTLLAAHQTLHASRTVEFLLAILFQRYIVESLQFPGQILLVWLIYDLIRNFFTMNRLPNPKKTALLPAKRQEKFTHYLNYPELCTAISDLVKSKSLPTAHRVLFRLPLFDQDDRSLLIAVIAEHVESTE